MNLDGNRAGRCASSLGILRAHWKLYGERGIGQEPQRSRLSARAGAARGQKHLHPSIDVHQGDPSRSDNKIAKGRERIRVDARDFHSQNGFFA